MGRSVLAAALLAASPALAQERDYCPTRPGLGTTPCTISANGVSIETALGDWTLADDSDQRSDTILIGDTLARLGVSDTLELQAGWTPYGHVRMRDKTSGAIDRAGRVGDVTLGAKLNLRAPDGKGASVAVQPFATLPVGRQPVGAGTWGAGVLVPVTFDVSDTLNLQTTSEIDAAPDGDGRGRHLAYSEILGLGIELSKSVTASIEAEVRRDEDPQRHRTALLASGSLAWMPKDDLQFDVGAVAGLNRDAPDLELYLGVSRRF